MLAIRGCHTGYNEHMMRGRQLSTQWCPRDSVYHTGPPANIYKTHTITYSSYKNITTSENNNYLVLYNDNIDILSAGPSLLDNKTV